MSSSFSGVLQECWCWAEYYVIHFYLLSCVRTHYCLAQSLPWYFQPIFFVFWLSLHWHGLAWRPDNCHLIKCPQQLILHLLMLCNSSLFLSFVLQCVHETWHFSNIHVQCESKKSGPLKLFAIFSLRLSIFPWNFASILTVHIYTHIYQFWSIYLNIWQNGIFLVVPIVFNVFSFKFHQVKSS